MLVQFNGTEESAQEIADGIGLQMFGPKENRAEGDVSEIVPVLLEDGMLQLDWKYYDGQLSPNRWRVPIGYSANTETGEVIDPQGNVVDMATLM